MTVAMPSSWSAVETAKAADCRCDFWYSCIRPGPIRGSEETGGATSKFRRAIRKQGDCVTGNCGVLVYLPAGRQI